MVSSSSVSLLSPTIVPITLKIGMGKPAITKRKFSPGRPRVKQVTALKLFTSPQTEWTEQCFFSHVVRACVLSFCQSVSMFCVKRADNRVMQASLETYRSQSTESQPCRTAYPLSCPVLLSESLHELIKQDHSILGYQAWHVSGECYHFPTSFEYLVALRVIGNLLWMIATPMKSSKV